MIICCCYGCISCLFQDVLAGSNSSKDYVSSILLETERSLGLLQGLHACRLAHSTPLSSEEEKCASILSADFMAGGLYSAQALIDGMEGDPGQGKLGRLHKVFERQVSTSDISQPFLSALTEAKPEDPTVQQFLALIER